MAKKPFKKRPSRAYAKRKPLWTPLAGVTQSSLEKFLACPEQFALSYVEGVTSNKLKTSLEFGSLFHLCCEFQGKESAAMVAKRVCEAYEKTRKTSLTGRDYSELQQLVGTVRTLFPLYVNYWKEKDAKMKWISREKMFSVPYTFNDMDGKPFTINLVGKRDGVFRNIPRDLCLRETKTKSEINLEAIRDGLRADFQSLFYLLALRIEFNEEPKEIDYNVVRRPGMYMGKKDSSMLSFFKRVEADILKRPTYYFARFRVMLSPGTIDKFRQVTLDPALRRLVQ